MLEALRQPRLQVDLSWRLARAEGRQAMVSKCSKNCGLDISTYDRAKIDPSHVRKTPRPELKPEIGIESA